jgi:hypothetical protein
LNWRFSVKVENHPTLDKTLSTIVEDSTTSVRWVFDFFRIPAVSGYLKTKIKESPVFGV